jgi:hypothetical protein
MLMKENISSVSSAQFTRKFPRRGAEAQREEGIETGEMSTGNFFCLLGGDADFTHGVQPCF